MSRDTEDLLRSALSRKAAAVTTGNLADQRPFEEIIRDSVSSASDHIANVPGQSTGRSWRALNHGRLWTGPLLAAVAVIAVLAATIGVIGALRSNDGQPATTVTAPPPLPSSTPATTPMTSPTAATSPSVRSTTPTTQASPPVLGLNQQGTRSEIPWDEVGTGWSLAGWATGISPANQPARTLYLLDPQGGRYLVGVLAAKESLGPWSPDGRRALISSADGVKEIDLVTGEVHTVLPATAGTFVDPYIYTRPSGKAFVAIASVGTAATTLEKFGLDGEKQASYPLTTAVGTGTRGLLYAADGSRLYSAASGGVTEYSNDGHVSKAIAAPPGDNNCGVLRPWLHDEVLALCLAADSTSRLYTVDYGRGVMSPLEGVPQGVYRDAYPAGSEVILIKGTGGFGCSGTSVDVMNRGKITPLNVPQPGNTSKIMIAVGGDAGHVLLKTGLCSQGQSPVSLISYDLTAAASVVVLGPGANGGSVFDLEEFPESVG